MSLDETMKQVAKTLENEVGVKAVFGEPMKLDNHTVVPVAMLGLGGGGGLLPALLGKLGEKASGKAGGAGAVAMAVRPIGFIHESGDEVVFTPIQTRGRDNPFAVQAASSLGHLANAVASFFARR
jgi:uncharacterized spore protein YtfJ